MSNDVQEGKTPPLIVDESSAPSSSTLDSDCTLINTADIAAILKDAVACARREAIQAGQVNELLRRLEATDEALGLAEARVTKCIELEVRANAIEASRAEVEAKSQLQEREIRRLDEELCATRTKLQHAQATIQFLQDERNSTQRKLERQAELHTEHIETLRSSLNAARERVTLRASDLLAVLPPVRVEDDP